MEFLIIILILIGVPISAMVISMFSYFGKILAIRLMFNKNIKEQGGNLNGEGQ